MLLAGPAEADPRAVRALADGLPMPGTFLDEVRSMPQPDGRRLICESDADKPKLANPGLMAQQRGRGSDHVRRCALFGDDGTGTWVQATRDTAFGPARLWLVFVEQGLSGRYRLAQLGLWAKTTEWDKAAKLLGDVLGPPDARAEGLLTWIDDHQETTLFVDEKYPDEFVAAVGDIRLRKLMKSPGTSLRE